MTGSLLVKPINFNPGQNKPLVIMKKAFFLLAVLLSGIVMAQGDKYTEAMQKAINAMDSSKTTAELVSAANTFERIADAEKTKWLPYYYAGLTYSTIGWTDQSIDKDANAEKIKAICIKAEAIEKNAEIYSLRNMAATQQMIVDPPTRWMTYGQEAGTALQKGLELEPNNPRLHYLRAMSILNTPEQFGGGKEKAKPMLVKTIELLKAEKAKPLYPNWGLVQAEAALQQANQ